MSENQRTVTKADLVEAVHEKVGFSKKISTEMVELVFGTRKSTLERGERIKVSGFGKFEVRHKKARRGRNPKTEAELIIPERHILTFKPSQVLKAAVAGDAVAGNGADSEPPTRADPAPPLDDDQSS
jgi:integration host factor subunit alpha